ncbi:MAG: dihydropteroate synthase [Alphaproteobacteria bacterium]|nr:dihydropteroate synthase [Alphaproteobacteria bacterium]
MGLLHGAAAAAAVGAGAAVWLAGGPTAFALARREGEAEIRPATAFGAALAPLTVAPPPWAGLPAGRPLVMGILNATPDSFSDGGRHPDPARAIAHGRAMLAEGADVIDVGGESTRPGAAPVPAEAEQARVLPVVRALAAEGAVISIDTRNAATMAAALDAGARIVNDVSALAHDPAAAALVAARRCPVVLMHMRGTPVTMPSLTRYRDAVFDVTHELAARVAAAEAAGVAQAAMALDPGIGFAKGTTANLDILARLPVLLNLGCRIVVGASRKGFIGKLTGEDEADRRAPGSIAAGLAALLGGALVLRVHDVAATVQAVRVWQAVFAAPHTS